MSANLCSETPKLSEQHPLTKPLLTGLSEITKQYTSKPILSIFTPRSLCYIILRFLCPLPRSYLCKPPQLSVACFRQVPVIPMKFNLGQTGVEICGTVDKRNFDKWFVV